MSLSVLDGDYDGDPVVNITWNCLLSKYMQPNRAMYRYITTLISCVHQYAAYFGETACVYLLHCHCVTPIFVER